MLKTSKEFLQGALSEYHKTGKSTLTFAYDHDHSKSDTLEILNELRLEDLVKDIKPLSHGMVEFTLTIRAKELNF